MRVITGQINARMKDSTMVDAVMFKHHSDLPSLEQYVQSTLTPMLQTMSWLLSLGNPSKQVQREP